MNRKVTLPLRRLGARDTPPAPWWAICKYARSPALPGGALALHNGAGDRGRYPKGSCRPRKAS